MRVLWTRFAAFCINLGPVLLRSASIWGRRAHFCAPLRTLSCAETWKTFFAHRCAHFRAQSCAKCTQLCATVRAVPTRAFLRTFAHTFVRKRQGKRALRTVAHTFVRTVRCARFRAQRCAIWGRFASFCMNVGPLRCVLH